jgi:hypothetical protein
MKSIYTLIFCTLILTTICSCNNANSKIEDFSEVISNAEEKQTNFSESEWKKLDDNLKEFEQDVAQNSNDYSPEQRENANKLIGRYKLLTVKRKINEFKKDLEDVGDQIDGMIESVDESTNK